MTIRKKALRITIKKYPNQHNNNQHEGTQNYNKNTTQHNDSKKTLRITIKNVPISITTPSMKAHKIIIKIQHSIMTISKKTLRITIENVPISTTPSMMACQILIKIRRSIMLISTETLRITIKKYPNQHSNTQHEGIQNFN
jgi:hypothetical protein